MIVKAILLLSLSVVVANSMFVPQSKCPVFMNSTAIKQDEAAAGKESCYKLGPSTKDVKKQTKNKKPPMKISCIHKCTLERKGVFDKEGKYFATAIKEHYKKYSNATEKYIEAVEKIYDECKLDAEKHIAELNKNGTKTVGKCRFHGYFADCAKFKVFKIQTC